MERGLVDRLMTGLLLVDNSAEARIDWCNQAALGLLRAPRPALLGQPIGDIEPALGSGLSRARARGQSLQISEIRLSRSEQLVDIHYQDEGGKTLIELHSVTERVRQREMAEKADRQQAQALMARALAHEIRNPLAGVRGAAQLIEAMNSDGGSRRHARMIQREVDRVTRLIEHFADAAPNQPESVNLHRILDEVIELIEAEQPAGVTIQRRYDPSIPELMANSGPLHQLFLNLMRNAAQANARTLLVSTAIEHNSPLVDEPARHAVRIDLDDDGDGVEPSLRSQLFLPLVSGRDNGSGFGLAVVQQIARSHGGLVEYLPLDRGSRFRVRIPLLRPMERDHE